MKKPLHDLPIRGGADNATVSQSGYSGKVPPDIIQVAGEAVLGIVSGVFSLSQTIRDARLVRYETKLCRGRCSDRFGYRGRFPPEAVTALERATFGLRHGIGRVLLVFEAGSFIDVLTEREASCLIGGDHE